MVMIRIVVKTDEELDAAEELFLKEKLEEALRELGHGEALVNVGY